MKARTSTIVAAVFVALASIALWPRTPASAASKAGDAEVVAPVDNTHPVTPLNAGTTTTPFSLQLPAGAACRGDSANDSYRVQSYMVPAAVDPATLQFGSVGPAPVGTGAKFRQPLFDLNTNPYANAQTAMATKKGGPGPIINIPGFNLAVYKAGDVPPGAYNVGIACTKGQASPSQLDTFWNTQIVVTAGPGGSAGPYAWSTPGARSSPSSANPSAPPAVEKSGAGTAPGASVNAGDAATAAGQTAVSAVGASAASDRPNDLKASGAPPSFGNPFEGVFAFIPVPGTSALGFAVWALIAVVALRVVLLVVRRRPSALSEVAS